MAETIDLTGSATPKKGKSAAKAKKPKTAPSHPKVAEMVNDAISTLKERGGSSLRAIKKHIASHYKVDVEKISPFIKKYLKTSVVSGGLVQTKGKGATGSFKISGSTGTEKSSKPKKASVKKVVKPKKAKAATPKKAAKPKAVVEKKKPVKAAPAKKAKPAAKKAKPAKSAAVKKAKATPKKSAAKRGKK